MSLEPGSDGHDLCHMPTLRATHNFYGLGAVMPLWAQFSIRKKIKSSILLLCCYKDKYNTVWFISFFCFSLDFQRSRCSLGSQGTLWAVDSVPILTYGGVGHTCSWGHSRKRQGLQLAFPIDTHEILLPWRSDAEKIKSGYFHRSPLGSQGWSPRFRCRPSPVIPQAQAYPEKFFSVLPLSRLQAGSGSRRGTSSHLGLSDILDHMWWPWGLFPRAFTGKASPPCPPV